jgi:hypothetical protein
MRVTNITSITNMGNQGVFRPIREMIMMTTISNKNRKHRERWRWIQEYGLSIHTRQMTKKNIYKRFPVKQNVTCPITPNSTRFIPYWETIRFEIHTILFGDDQWVEDRYFIVCQLNELMESFGFSIKKEIYDIAMGNGDNICEERQSIRLPYHHSYDESRQLFLYFFLKSFFAHPSSSPSPRITPNIITKQQLSTLDMLRLWRQLIF